MHEGWKRRREMEAAIGREALRRTKYSNDDDAEEDDRFAEIARLARQATDAALDQLCSIVEESDDEVRFAARVALRSSARRRSPENAEEYDS